MKKLTALLLALILVVALVACGGGEGEPVDDGGDDVQAPYIALVTDVGNIDDESFNQACWEAVKEFADANGLEYNYYRPSEDSTEARVVSMQAAIEDGAVAVVCPGFLFEDAVYQLQYDNPTVNFILIDGQPHSSDYSVYDTNSNVHCLIYKEEQAGFFAGYAAVMDGYTKFGYVGGMEIPSVQRFGYGYIQGIEYAAVEKGVNPVVEYWYANIFAPSDEIYNTCTGWYANGTEVIFACGGSLYQSVVKAAEEVNGKVIGVDVDQSYVSETIITSAMKQLKITCKAALASLMANEWVWPADYAGVTATLGADSDGTGLPTDSGSWRFSTFTVEEYEAIRDGVIDGSIVVSDNVDALPETVNTTVNKY